ncbi:MAG: hypothetical protein JWM49_2039 [Microbacteriaceae bacterium]|nr:hypothetical protein [Microbacteriaceae bacterium]
MIIADTALSVSDIEELYQLRNIRDYFQDPEVTAAERLEDIRIELRELKS